ncbi:MAG: menaquinone biosynthetic enzyme MqnA/MqnD family protein [Armatimonadota bacterium]
MKTTVLGCLPYLNVRPLIRSIERRPPEGYELVYDTPSGLAVRLREGSCDIAAVSSFEALANPELEIIPGFAIASDGPVTSVLMFSQRPFSSVCRVALDTSSLSGAALTRIVLADQFGTTPEFVRLEPYPADMLSQADACLLIGNNAMLHAPQVPHVLDLGEAWKELTGLPFVFGVWAARRGRADERDLLILQEARRAGMRDLETIAREEAINLGLPPALILRYLAEIMVYDMGERELAGLREFLRRSREHGLLDPSAEVRLWQASEPHPSSR